VPLLSRTIVQPEGLVVYDANYDSAARGKEPPRIQAMNVKVGATPSYRVVAEESSRAVAGAIRVEWTSADPSKVEVESYTRGVVNLRAKAAGITKITVTGGALSKEINVEVTQ